MKIYSLFPSVVSGNFYDIFFVLYLVPYFYKLINRFTVARSQRYGIVQMSVVTLVT